jgi:hypothetical protein
MKSSLIKFTLTALLPVALLVVAGCETASTDNQTIVVHFNKGVPGGTAVETFQTSARVVAVNTAVREVTFVGADNNSTNIYRAGPQVMNFDSYQVGTMVKITVAHELEMSLDTNDPPTLSGAEAAVEATPGIVPGVWTAEPVRLTAQVTAVNPQKREATLHISDGRTATFKVRPDIDLTQVNIGAECLIRITSALVVLQEKP